LSDDVVTRAELHQTLEKYGRELLAGLIEAIGGLPPGSISKRVGEEDVELDALRKAASAGDPKARERLNELGKVEIRRAIQNPRMTAWNGVEGSRPGVPLQAVLGERVADEAPAAGRHLQRIRRRLRKED